MQQQMQELQKKSKLDQAAGGPPPAVPPVRSRRHPPERTRHGQGSAKEPKFDKFLKGFYGTLDVSVDYTTKGINDPSPISYPGIPGAPGTRMRSRPRAEVGSGGHVGYMLALSTNDSGIGYRGSHPDGEPDVDFIYQVDGHQTWCAGPEHLASTSQSKSPRVRSARATLSSVSQAIPGAR